MIEQTADGPRFKAYPSIARTTFLCEVCGHYSTYLTTLHVRAHACTGCMLRTLRPYDYTVPRVPVPPGPEDRCF